MSEILRRKLARAQMPEASPHALVDQAWRLALARALREGASLASEVTAISSRQCDLAELPELPPERALIALLDGPGGEMGIACFSPDLTCSLIEMQTIGRVGTAPPGPRRPTRTDAAMVSPVLDRALSRFDFLVRDLPETRVGQGYRFASLLEDARSIGLLLDDQPFHLLTVTLSLAEGARSGEVLLALPISEAGGNAQAATAQPRPAAGPEFDAGLGQTEVELQAVLGHRMLTLSEVMQLEPGQLLMLNDASIARISLRGIDGKPVALARLGQQNGHRALRISLFASGGEMAPMAAAGLPAASFAGGSGEGLADPDATGMEFAAAGQEMEPGPGIDLDLGEGVDFRASA